jgi:sialic acid synthase SpsE
MIIAELCQNHLGDGEILDQMIDRAAENGATHIKIQNIYADLLSYRPRFESGVVIDNKIKTIKRPYADEYERLKALELTNEMCCKFVEKCKALGVVPLTTCFAHESIDEIIEQGFSEIKVASYDCGSRQLLERLAKHFSVVHISTGATFEEEILCARDIMVEAEVDYYFYHCVTIYPTPMAAMNLNRLGHLMEITALPNVGLSEHSDFSKDGVNASLAALYLGAASIERHFTILNPEDTKDGRVSVDPSGLKLLSEFSILSKSDQLSMLNSLSPNWSDVLMGDAQRNLSEEELLNRDYYRGRFASRRKGYDNSAPIYNWEPYSD